MHSGFFADVFQTFLFGPCRTIRTVAGQCIPYIHDRKDARHKQLALPAITPLLSDFQKPAGRAV
jgi:hypothetical protein